MQLIQDPLLAGRLISALAGIATTFGVFLVGRSLSGNRVGLMARRGRFSYRVYEIDFPRLTPDDSTLSHSGSSVENRR